MEITLDSLRNQTKKNELDFEIIVVDNNSNDDTKLVIEKFKSLHDNKLKYIFEKNPGHSCALNTGVECAQGDIIALTDDDVTVSENWLVEILNSMDNFNCDCFGGKILPLWSRTPPAWLTKKFWSILALLDFGDEAFFITGKESLIYGANFIA